MSEPIDELISYANHTHGCMGAAGHDMCTCGYDDAYAKMWAAWEALKAENARLREALRKYGQHDNGALSYHPCKQAGMNADLFPCTCGLDAALSAGPLEKGHE